MAPGADTVPVNPFSCAVVMVAVSGAERQTVHLHQRRTGDVGAVGKLHDVAGRAVASSCPQIGQAAEDEGDGIAGGRGRDADIGRGDGDGPRIPAVVVDRNGLDVGQGGEVAVPDDDDRLRARGRDRAGELGDLRRGHGHRGVGRDRQILEPADSRAGNVGAVAQHQGIRAAAAADRTGCRPAADVHDIVAGAAGDILPVGAQREVHGGTQDVGLDSGAAGDGGVAVGRHQGDLLGTGPIDGGEALVLDFRHADRRPAAQGERFESAEGGQRRQITAVGQRQRVGAAAAGGGRAGQMAGVRHGERFAVGSESNPRGQAGADRGVETRSRGARRADIGDGDRAGAGYAIVRPIIDDDADRPVGGVGRACGIVVLHAPQHGLIDCRRGRTGDLQDTGRAVIGDHRQAGSGGRRDRRCVERQRFGCRVRVVGDGDRHRRDVVAIGIGNGAGRRDRHRTASFGKAGRVVRAGAACAVEIDLGRRVEVDPGPID